MRPRAALAMMSVAALATGCQQHRVEQRCGSYPVMGLSLDATTESYRRAAMRHELRLQEALAPGFTLRAAAATADDKRLARNEVCAVDLYETGRLIFEHAFTPAEGASAVRHRVQRGRRGGPETTSCTSCHWRGGPAGAGSIVDDSYLLGDHDRISSADARNPPSLAGAGLVQALASEMSAELAAQREHAVARARSSGQAVDVALQAKGIAFGTVTITAQGRMLRSKLEGIDPDLVVRPFGWKGTAATIPEFIAEATMLHFGVLPASLLAPDATGRQPLDIESTEKAELTNGQVIALSVYVAGLAAPTTIAPLDASGQTTVLADAYVRGRRLFETVGCSSCHQPRLPLRSPMLTLSAGSVRGPRLDLSRDTESPQLVRTVDGVYYVDLYSDLKRHDLGAGVESKHVQGGIAPRLYLTRPLWGLADSAPYFHDGSAATVDAAIARHNGEAGLAHDNWDDLSLDDRNALRLFLMSLRRPPGVQIP